MEGISILTSGEGGGVKSSFRIKSSFRNFEFQPNVSLEKFDFLIKNTFYIPLDNEFLVHVPIK